MRLVLARWRFVVQQVFENHKQCHQQDADSKRLLQNGDGQTLPDPLSEPQSDQASQDKQRGDSGGNMLA